jgi:site-specific recombinase XerC
MIQLPNGCKCSDIKVQPSNWNKSTASIKKNWRIHYRFYDPSHDKPYQVTIKAGINKINDLNQRRVLVQELTKQELEKLQVKGYNPFTASMVESIVVVSDIAPTTLFIAALNKASEKLAIAHRTKIDVNSVIRGVEKAARQLGIAGLPISSISRKHIKVILEQCGKNNPRWSARRYNLYRAYLLMLFKELVELEAVTANPIRDISKMKETKKLRTVLTPKQRQEIDEHLQQNDYRFRQFVHLFFHSGARLQELVQIKRNDVDLINQKYKTVIRKGKAFKEVERTIKNVALPYWREFVSVAQENEYLFGIDFEPAKRPMVANTITRRWHKWVKTGLMIDVDLYSLKHLNTTETVTCAGEKVAAQQNAHTTTAMVISTYDVHRASRQHEILKNLQNTFA